MNFPKIGMRNIKTSISVFLCLLLFQILNRDNALQACIAAVICMQNTIVDSYKKGIERVKGTILGGIGGAFVLYLITNFGYEDIIIFVIPLGIVILIELCVTLNMKQSVVICCVVYLGILITIEREGGPVIYAVNRVIDTTIGIMITIIVNKYIKVPEKIKNLIRPADAELDGDYIIEQHVGKCENEQDIMDKK